MSSVTNLKRHLDDTTSESYKDAKKIASDVNSECENFKSRNVQYVESPNNLNRQENVYYTRATESDVGITEFISNLPGFIAVLKERYSDFLVNEIDMKQNVVRLTNLDKPSDPVFLSKLNNVLDEETMAKLDALCCQNDESAEVMIEVTDMDKDARKEIHVGLRQSYNNVDSTTIDENGKKFIVVKRCFKKGNRFQPPVGGNYTHFVLYKENKDTIDTINTIASFLRVQPKIFSYAGTKDKRAKTSQLVSAYRLRSEKLLGINKHFQMIKIGNIEYKSEQIKLGDLYGNSFVIILRQFDGNEENIDKAMHSLSSKGFINYYGMQRFGTSCVPTHIIGRALLLGNWKEAIDLILTPKSEDDDELSTAKKIWLQTRNAKEALKKIRRKYSIEAKLLKGVATNNENDLVNALNAVPRNMRLMYIHSYQSFIWNKVVSKRIQKYGLKVLKGDLISNSSAGLKESLELTKEGNRKLVLSNMIKFVSEEDMENINITDILLPLPGHSVVFPENETKEWYDEYLRSDRMDLVNFESKTKTYSLSGDYRKLIVIPKDIKWEILSYDDNTLPLALSDLDILNGVKLPDSSKGGAFKALKVEIKLPSSSYATMALREIQKSDLSNKL